MSDELLNRMHRVFGYSRDRLEAAMIETATWELQEMLAEISVVMEHGPAARILMSAGYTAEEVAGLAQLSPGPLWDAVLRTATQAAAVRPDGRLLPLPDGAGGPWARAERVVEVPAVGGAGWPEDGAIGGEQGPDNAPPGVAERVDEPRVQAEAPGEFARASAPCSPASLLTTSPSLPDDFVWADFAGDSRAEDGLIDDPERRRRGPQRGAGR